MANMDPEKRNRRRGRPSLVRACREKWAERHSSLLPGSASLADQQHAAAAVRSIRASSQRQERSRSAPPSARARHQLTPHDAGRRQLGRRLRRFRKEAGSRRIRPSPRCLPEKQPAPPPCNNSDYLEAVADRHKQHRMADQSPKKKLARDFGVNVGTVSRRVRGARRRGYIYGLAVGAKSPKRRGGRTGSPMTPRGSGGRARYGRIAHAQPPSVSHAPASFASSKRLFERACSAGARHRPAVAALKQPVVLPAKRGVRCA
jgi:hypothetical protein